MRLVLSTAVVFAVTLPALAQTDPPPAATPNEIVYRNIAGPAEVPNAPAGDDTMVCNYQQETGSLMITRVCRTLRAWKIMQADAHEFFEYNHLGAHAAQQP